MTADAILQLLRAAKQELAKTYHAGSIELFGSWSRGDQREDSDVDLLVEFDADADLFHLVGMAEYLERLLGRKVDIVPKRALRTEIRAEVLREAVLV